MGNRQIPKGIEESDFDQKIDFLESFLGSNWLNSQKKKASVLKQLWSRRDYLASTELYTISDALQSLNVPENAAWLSEYKKHVKAYDNAATISGTYELVSATMFEGADQRVNLCRVDNPGYDFSITTERIRVRVSCKKLTSSESERRFQKRSATLYAFTKDAVRQSGLNALQIIVYENNAQHSISDAETKEALLQGLRLYKGNSRNRTRNLALRLPKVSIRIGPIPVDVTGWKYHSGNISVIFICYSAYSEIEQDRFENLFRRAASNLKNQGELKSENNLNVIMIGLPVCVSLGQAREWLVGKFEREHKSITGVLLNRILPAKDRDLEQSEIVSEIAFIPNPREDMGTQQLLEACMKPRKVSPASMISNQDSELWLISGEERVAIPNGYLFQKGDIFHEHVSGNMEYNFPGLKSGIHYHSIFHPQEGDRGLMLSNISPPEELFVIL